MTPLAALARAYNAGESDIGPILWDAIAEAGWEARTSRGLPWEWRFGVHGADADIWYSDGNYRWSASWWWGHHFGAAATLAEAQAAAESALRRALCGA